MGPLFVCKELGPGGAQRHWAILIRGLHERGLGPRLLTLGGEGRYFTELRATGVPVRCAGPRQALRSHEEAGVVVAYGVMPQLVAWRLARRAGARLIANEHTPCAATGGLLPLRPRQRPLMRLVAPRADRVIAVSAAQLDPLARRGYRRERMTVVSNGVPRVEDRPASERSAVRATLGLGEGDFAVLMTAALRPEKRADVFVEAVRLARRSSPKLRGFLAGDGPEAARLRGLAEGSGVELLGVRDDVPELLLAADAACLSSSAEALPMSLLEAMACGLPVVVTDVGGVREAVVDGETGSVVPAEDPAALAGALVALGADTTRAAAMGQAGRRRQRELFDAEAMVDRYAELLREPAR